MARPVETHCERKGAGERQIDFTPLRRSRGSVGFSANRRRSRRAAARRARSLAVLRRSRPIADDRTRTDSIAIGETHVHAEEALALSEVDAQPPRGADEALDFILVLEVDVGVLVAPTDVGERMQHRDRSTRLTDAIRSIGLDATADVTPSEAPGSVTGENRCARIFQPPTKNAKVINPPRAKDRGPVRGSVTQKISR